MSAQLEITLAYVGVIVLSMIGDVVGLADRKLLTDTIVFVLQVLSYGGGAVVAFMTIKKNLKNK